MAKQKSEKNWHALHTPQLLHAFQTSEHGLSAQEAKQRLASVGANVLTPKKSSLLKRLIAPFTSLFIIVLLLAIAISLAMGERLDATIIGFIVILNAIIFYFQQYSVNRVLKTLKSQEDGSVTVIRNGQDMEVPASQLVPGDIVLVFEGTKIPADGRLLEVTNLQVNESMLTGESLPIHKQSEPLPIDIDIYDQKNMVFKGTFVHGGSGSFLVCSTGNKTQLGAITQLASTGDSGKTPIERKIDDITKHLVRGIGIVGVAVFGLALLRGTELSEALRFSLSLVVSVVPEGLPVTLTVVLLLSAKKMAAHKALVKKLSAIETMGAVTLIATDKTGTLTENKLQVVETLDSTGHLSRTASGSITMQNGVVMDPLDDVLLTRFKHPSERKRIHDFPFDQQLRVSGALVKDGSQYRLYLKGAPEVFLKNLAPHQRYRAQNVLDEFTKKGYRIIGFAHAVATKSTTTIDKQMIKKATFDGFVALADPIRKGIANSIAEAKAAGIKIVMLTGDHVNTAEEIARQAGLVTSHAQVAESKLLNKPPNHRIMQTILERISVFGRVLPKHKFNFLRSVKKQEITAMTGDGVNDIPALIEADAGLAMGSGTDAAKDASDIVLLDDNFATIIDAVRLGRSVIANIRKILFYLISTSIGEASTMIGALLLGLPLPVTAVQILWVNVVTDSFTVLPLGLSSPERHQMKQPPYNPKAPLLSRILVSRTIFTGIMIAGIILLIFYFFLDKGEAYAQTAAFIALVVVQWANALNASFERSSWLANFRRPNYKLFAGIFLSVIFQGIVLYGPLREYFGIVSLSMRDFLLCSIIPFVSILLIVDAHKLGTKLFVYNKSKKEAV